MIGAPVDQNARRPSSSCLRALTALLMFAFVGVACDREAPVRVKKILVDVEPSAERAIDREAVRAAARTLIDGDRGFDVDEDATEGHVARVRVFVATSGDPPTKDDPIGDDHVARAESGRRPALVSLALEITPTSGVRTAPVALRASGVAHGEGGAAVEPLLTAALRDALTGIVDARVSSAEDSDVLIARILDETRAVRVREQAIRALGHRKEKAAVPALLATLARREEVLSPAALHALGQIGDPSSVDGVIDYASGQPSPIRKAAIDAVRSIDTPRGRAWLFTLSTGHPDPDVQLAATTALGVLDARVAGDSPPVDQRVQ